MPSIVKTTGEIRVASHQDSIPEAIEGSEPTPFSSRLAFSSDTNFTEFVEVNIYLNHRSFRDLEITLESPSGAVSTLAVPHDEKAASVARTKVNTYIRFGSARHLGEDPNGEWILTVKDHYPDDSGHVRGWGITVYGHPGGNPNRPAGVTRLQSCRGTRGVLERALHRRRAHFLQGTVEGVFGQLGSSRPGVGSDSSRHIALTYTITGLTDGAEYSVRVIATNASGDSAPSAEVAATPGSNPATGTPTISGTAQVGETLRASTSGISDADGMSGATFSYQWISSDGNDRLRHTGGGRSDLHTGEFRPGQDYQGACDLHRRRGLRGDSHEPGHRGSCRAARHLRSDKKGPRNHRSQDYRRR